MIRIITGPSGTGKTEEIIKSAAADLKNGKKVYIFVPEQSAVIAEHRISIYCQENKIPETGLEILSFKRLADSYYRRYGGFADCVSSRSVRLITMWKAFLGVAPGLGYYKDLVSRADTFVPTLLSEIEELRSYGVSPENLSKAAESDFENDSTALKIKDICLIYSEYNRLSAENGDTADDMMKIDEGLAVNRFFDGSSVYLDGFSGFTGVEYNIIRRMMRQAEGVTFSLCCEDGRPSLFGNINGLPTGKRKSTLDRLCDIAGGRDSVKIEKLVRQEKSFSDGLSHIEKNLYRDGAKPYFETADEIKSTDEVEFVRLSDPYDEAEYVACDILRQCRENGKCAGDFAVTVGSPEYARIVNSVFEKHKIPVHLAVKTEITETPLFRFVISALGVKYENWLGEDIIGLIKTGLTDISPEECDLLDGYVKLWRIRGKAEWEKEWTMNPKGFEYSEEHKTYKELDRINEIRRKIFKPLEAFCESFDGEKTVKDICVSLYRFLCSFDIPGKSIGEDARIFNILCDVLDAIVKTVGDLVPKNTSAFTEIFSLAVSGAGTGSIPRTSDSVSLGLFGGVYGRTSCMYMVGCASGVLPPEITEKGIFSDSDKVALETDDIILSPCTDSVATENSYNFYRAVCTARERVVFTRSERDSKGEETAPSEQYSAVMNLFCRDSEDGANPMEKSGIPGEFRIQDKISAYECRGLLTGTKEAAALDKIIPDGKSTVPFVSSIETVDKESAEKFYDKTIEISPSRLETYANCPFKYECSYILGLKERKIKTENGLIDPIEIGSLMHFVLEKFFASVRDENDKNAFAKYASDKDLVLEKVSSLVRAYIEGVLGKDYALSDKQERDFRKIGLRVAAVIIRLCSMLEGSSFTPLFFEYKIKGENAKVFTDSNGHHVKIVGKVDRIDTAVGGNEIVFRVIDYKSGGKAFDNKVIKYGINIQMLLYLVSISMSGDDIKNALPGCENYPLAPAAVLYVPIKTTIDESGAFAEDKKDKEKPTGIINDEYKEMFEKIIAPEKGGGLLKSKEIFEEMKNDLVSAVNELIKDMTDGKADAIPIEKRHPEAEGKDTHPCEYCEYNFVCRRKKNDKEEGE